MNNFWTRFKKILRKFEQLHLLDRNKIYFCLQTNQNSNSHLNKTVSPYLFSVFYQKRKLLHGIVNKTNIQNTWNGRAKIISQSNNFFENSNDHTLYFRRISSWQQNRLFLWIKLFHQPAWWLHQRFFGSETFDIVSLVTS